MPSIDFYVLSDAAPDAHLRQACRLAAQAADQGQRVFVRVDDDNARRMDDLLWTFGDGAFLPHEIATPQSPSHPKISILIGQQVPASHRDLVINLASAAPELAGLQRVAEIVPVEAELKRQARERFKFYREQGLQPASHNL
jgi:DNA polymerase III subunit chi